VAEGGAPLRAGGSLGVPLRDGDGRVLGALCVADPRAAPVELRDVEALEALAAAAAAEVALRRERAVRAGPSRRWRTSAASGSR
jgi:GAF domain-containing protein